MELIYRSAFIIGITLLFPVIIRYLTAKSEEKVAFFAFLSSKDWENMCYTAVVIFVSIIDFTMWNYYKNNIIIVLDNHKIKVVKGRKSRILPKSKITYKKINSCKIKLFYKDKKFFTITRQFDNFENMQIWLNNLEQKGGEL